MAYYYFFAPPALTAQKSSDYSIAFSFNLCNNFPMSDQTAIFKPNFNVNSNSLSLSLSPL